MDEESINRMNSEIEKMEVTINDPELFLYRYFQKVRNEIDLKAEIMIKEINDQRDDFIIKLAQFEEECKSKAKEEERIKEINYFYESIQSQFKQWSQQINQLFEQKTLTKEEMQLNVDKKIEELEKELIKSQNYLLLNKNCHFETTISTSIGQLNFKVVEGVETNKK